MSATVVEEEMITYAAANIDQVSKHGQTELHGGAGCVMKVDTEAMTDNTEDAQGSWTNAFYSSDNKAWPLLDHHEGEEGGEFADQIATFDVPLRAPKNWAHEVPADSIGISHHRRRRSTSTALAAFERQRRQIRPCQNLLFIKKMLLHGLKSAEANTPTQVYNTEKNGEPIQATRFISIMKIDQDLPGIQITLGQAMDITTAAKEAFWSPKSLYSRS